MSKTEKKEKVIELPKNPQDYSYRGDEMLQVPASVFLLMYRANEKALKEGMSVSYPTKTKWISNSTGLAPEEALTEEDKVSGAYQEIMDIEGTYSRQNIVEHSAEWLFPEIIQLKDELIRVHSNAVEAGVATKIVDLQAEAKAFQEKASKDISDIEVEV